MAADRERTRRLDHLVAERDHPAVAVGGDADELRPFELHAHHRDVAQPRRRGAADGLALSGIQRRDPDRRVGVEHHPHRIGAAEDGGRRRRRERERDAEVLAVALEHGADGAASAGWRAALSPARRCRAADAPGRAPPAARSAPEQQRRALGGGADCCGGGLRRGGRRRRGLRLRRRRRIRRLGRRPAAPPLAVAEAAAAPAAAAALWRCGGAASPAAAAASSAAPMPAVSRWRARPAPPPSSDSSSDRTEPSWRAVLRSAVSTSTTKLLSSRKVRTSTRAPKLKRTTAESWSASLSIDSIIGGSVALASARSKRSIASNVSVSLLAAVVRRDADQLRQVEDVAREGRLGDRAHADRRRLLLLRQRALRPRCAVRPRGRGGPAPR